jgi:plastocyanin
MRAATHATRYRMSVIVALAMALAVALAGCGSSGGGQATSAASPTAAPVVGTAVSVVEKEFSITLPKTTMSPGTYTFRVSNQGTVSHNLTVAGPGVATKTTPTISPGESGDVTVTLQKGSYEFWCSVDHHKDQGMDLTVKVG